MDLIPSAHNPRVASVALGEGNRTVPSREPYDLIPSAHNPRVASVALGEGNRTVPSREPYDLLILSAHNPYGINDTLVGC
ncbi:hypothetical protein [Ferrimicrobium acidiphilum]|uniref:hypothetical protein n=1 Tax=Ferrimicrobium acidiphilum TaxID=121039 RepID=UPI0023F4BBC0|nr:hypothetical protein [Ferrimicrobium acidiphilum]